MTKTKVTKVKTKPKKRKPKQKYNTLKDYKKAIEGSLGIQTNVADVLGIDRSAVTLFIRDHPEVKVWLEQERTKIVDKAEKVLVNQLEFSDFKNPTGAEGVKHKASTYILSRLGRDRGFGDKTEIEHSGIVHTINIIEKSVEEIKDSKFNNKPKTKGNS